LRVEQLLEASAERTPDKTALVSGGRRLTYADLDDLSGRFASGLSRLGVRRGDRVVIQLENGPEAIVALFGTLKAGAVFVLVNPSVKADKLIYLVTDSGAAALVASCRNPAHLTALREGTAALGTTIVVVEDDELPPSAAGKVTPLAQLLQAPADERRADSRGNDIDLAALIYTSGSTGRPKGVMMTHLNIVSATTSIAGYLRNTPDDVILNAIPLSFDYGLYQVFMACKVGATLVLERSFTYLTALLDTIVRERVTGFPIVPTIAALLLKHNLGAYDFGSLRYLSSTAAAFPAGHIAALRHRLPKVTLYSMYGLTECKRVSFLPPEDLATRPTSVGRPMDNVEVFVEVDGKLKPHGVGQLIVRGSNVMQGYWNRPEETAHALRPGNLPGERLLYSGDIFRIDDEGYMYFVSRTDDIIKSCGEKVSPREVEAAIYELPAVLEAVVVGVPDPILGEAIKAYVSVEPGAAIGEQDVVKHCAQRLENVMIPRSVEFVPIMPRTLSGKVDRKALRTRVTT
jgi:long-chain acyl-CoA synthetase